MQITFGIILCILCILLKGLVLTKAIITFVPKDYTPSNSLQEESDSICPDLNSTQDILMFEKNDHRNLKSDRSYSDSMTVRKKREVNVVPLASNSTILKSIENSLSKPTSLRAFVEFDRKFAKKINDIFVTLRWNQPEFIDEIIQGYTVQCFFIEDLKDIQICDDKNITTTKLEHTVHNLTSNMTYYFRVRAHSKIVAGPYTDLINVSTTHENPIPKLLVTSGKGIYILDVDFTITNFVTILYHVSYHHTSRHSYRMIKYHLDEKINLIVPIKTFCLYRYKPDLFRDMKIDNMNNEGLLICWLSKSYIIVTDVNISMCNAILHTKYLSDIRFQSITIDKTNIYILAYKVHTYNAKYIYVLKKKYASLTSINATKNVEKIISYTNESYQIYAIDKSLQPYPPMRCLTPHEKVYNFENVNATANNILVTLQKPIVKRGCKKYNLPTTIYTISVSCLDNNLNKFVKFNVQTFKRVYRIWNLTPFTEYKLKFTLSNFYFDQLPINPFDSNVIQIKTNSGKLNAPENISVLALTPTIAVVHWMPLKKENCVAVTYEVHWKSDTLVNGMQQKGKQFIKMPKPTADGRFFTKINLSLPVQDYLIYVRVYPNNFSDFYNESLGKIDHIYSEPNDITLSKVEINSIDISWIPNIHLTVSPTLEYKENATEKWQTMNYVKMNYNKQIIYHIGNLQSKTLYKFRLVLRYPEYEENFIWPADERFMFSTLGKQTKISIHYNNIAWIY
ncbi:Proto-oncogene tyrosine-protein kinase ROS [Camponotus floridanus]|uniref:Proto-oncogene tyrosine-protein kinase ROS n=1 Tax=Camponotus floridanus TaxID=104421 RepID=E2AM97_CAMFO|nr:Proto-oncogene tyrosine-protein kinase ROS [Camponotus floridanus]